MRAGLTPLSRRWPRLGRFREGVYDCFTRWPDALFEVTDALAGADRRIRSIAELTLEGVGHRGWGSFYQALNHGGIDTSMAQGCAGRAGPAGPTARPGRGAVAAAVRHGRLGVAPSGYDGRRWHRHALRQPEGGRHRAGHAGLVGVVAGPGRRGHRGTDPDHGGSSDGRSTGAIRCTWAEWPTPSSSTCSAVSITADSITADSITAVSITAVSIRLPCRCGRACAGAVAAGRCRSVRGLHDPAVDPAQHRPGQPGTTTAAVADPGPLRSNQSSPAGPRRRPARGRPSPAARDRFAIKEPTTWGQPDAEHRHTKLTAPPSQPRPGTTYTPKRSTATANPGRHHRGHHHPAGNPPPRPQTPGAVAVVGRPRDTRRLRPGHARRRLPPPVHHRTRLPIQKTGPVLDRAHPHQPRPGRTMGLDRRPRLHPTPPRPTPRRRPTPPPGTNPQPATGSAPAASAAISADICAPLPTLTNPPKTPPTGPGRPNRNTQPPPRHHNPSTSKANPPPPAANPDAPKDPKTENHPSLKPTGPDDVAYVPGLYGAADLAVAVLPVGVAQLALVELAVRVARQLVDVVDGARQLELRQPVAEERAAARRSARAAARRPSRAATTALISSPQSSCGMPNTATSATSGWQRARASISAG